MECYFDNSATTKPIPAVVDAMVEMLTTNYGNPSSLHKKGDAAAKALQESRDALAKEFGCSPDEVFFTSGGTESNNISIMGAAHSLRRRGNRIVTTCIEHPSVLECMTQLEEEGFEVIKLPVNAEGVVEESSLFEAITDKTILVSIMYVNNELGSVQPIKTARTAIKRANAPALLHVDAVQAFGKLPCKVSALGVDLMSVSSHKIHGPKGQGALYVKKGTHLKQYVLGGGQENGVRSGTQGMPGIVGLATAVSELPNLDDSLKYVDGLRTKLLEELTSEENLVVNSKGDFPYIVNLSLEGVPSEVLRNFLSEQDIFVSTGSACSKGHRSYVLTSIGLKPNIIDSAIRISFSRFNTEEEVLALANGLKRANKMLRKVC